MPSLVAFGLGLVIGLALAVPVALAWCRRAEERARASERRAREAEHLAYVGTLTGGLAHELRNPLSTLNLNLQLLKEDLGRPGRPADARLLRKLDTIEQEAKRLEEILNDFLKLAGKHDVKLKVQPINPALEEAVAFYRERLERSGVTVRTSFADALPPVALDASLMNQALLNLI
ncbi:MAG TPA: histidine kinase dimerization/phospho-acceptor domain-containing protein, partial [Phycisphaerae bacterium]|nr:histidine kinase dimerization/phospho-acceptor domain-containing protein [Phycisphaerae bacterium]